MQAVSRLVTERDRLRDELEHMHIALDYELSNVERLRAVLTKIKQWDSLNPPAPQSDFPWLKRLVDEALASVEADPVPIGENVGEPGTC